jgi:hypothetical protein
MKRFDPRSPAFWDSVLLGILLVAMSSQINLGDIGKDTYATEGYVTKQLKIALPDIALLLNLVWFAARTTLARGWKRLWWPPLPCWVLLFAIVLSLVHSPSIWNKAGEVVSALSEEVENPSASQQVRAVLKDKGAFGAVKEGIAETIQFGLYFLVAPTLLVNLLIDRRDTRQAVDRRRFALGAFALGAAVMVGIGLWQSIFEMRDAPKGLFSSPNAFAAWAAIATPLALAWAQGDDSLGRLRRLSFPIAAFAMLVVMSLWSHLAAIIGLVVAVALSRGVRQVRLGVITLLLGAFVGVLWSQQPRDARRESFVRVGSGQEKVKKQYIEWQAAQGFAAPRQRAFATGVGPGNYQVNIGSFYASLPNEEKMPPDSNNLYIVQGVSLGLFGLAALLWTVGHFASRALHAARSASDEGRWLAVGVLGSLAAWAFVNIFHASIVRGTGLVLALLFALAVVCGERWVSQRETESNEKQLSGI